MDTTSSTFEITIPAGALAAQLQIVGRICTRPAPVISALKHVRLETMGDQIEVHATDTEARLTSLVPADVAVPGAALIPASSISELVGLVSPTSPVRLVGRGTKIDVTVADYRATLQVPELSDFPDHKPEIVGPSVTLSSDALSCLIERTRRSAPSTDVKTAPAAILLTRVGAVLRAVSTDGHRMAVADAVLADTVDGEPFSALMPRLYLGDVLAFMDHEPVTLTISENHLAIATGARLLVLRRLTTLFPAYERVLPKALASRWRVHSRAVEQAIKRVAITTSEDKLRDKFVTFRLVEGGLHVEGVGHDVGESSDTIAAQSHGPAVDFRLNVRFPLDFLSAVPEGPIEICANDSTSAVEWRPALDGAADPDYRAVMMPTR